jgi:acyl-CoA synthetase (AMP-forming)/AMP-acid ligase II
LHTSGTTGVPKRVPGRHRELVARIRLLADILGLTPASIVTAGSPLHHIAGLGQILVGLGAGAAVAPLPGGAAGHWSELAALGATHTLLVPTMLHDLLERGALADAPLQVIQYGAAPITPGLVRRVIEALPEVRLIQLYGQTEGSPLTGLDDDAHRAGSGLDTVGVALPGVELRLDGEEVVARAAHLFGAVDGAWLHTGDLGTLDAQGRLRLIGRAGDRIVRGGENVDPTEVEALIAGHPSIWEVAVVGIPDERLGQRIRAYVVGDDVDFDEIRVWTRARTMGFKVPDEWVRIPELPRSPAGKVLRRALLT